MNEEVQPMGSPIFPGANEDGEIPFMDPPFDSLDKIQEVDEVIPYLDHFPNVTNEQHAVEPSDEEMIPVEPVVSMETSSDNVEEETPFPTNVVTTGPDLHQPTEEHSEELHETPYQVASKGIDSYPSGSMLGQSVSEPSMRRQSPVADGRIFRMIVFL